MEFKSDPAEVPKTNPENNQGRSQPVRLERKSKRGKRFCNKSTKSFLSSA